MFEGLDKEDVGVFDYIDMSTIVVKQNLKRILYFCFLLYIPLGILYFFVMVKYLDVSGPYMMYFQTSDVLSVDVIEDLFSITAIFFVAFNLLTVLSNSVIKTGMLIITSKSIAGEEIDNSTLLKSSFKAFIKIILVNLIIALIIFIGVVSMITLFFVMLTISAFLAFAFVIIFGLVFAYLMIFLSFSEEEAIIGGKGIISAIKGSISLVKYNKKRRIPSICMLLLLVSLIQSIFLAGMPFLYAMFSILGFIGLAIAGCLHWSLLSAFKVPKIIQYIHFKKHTYVLDKQI